MGCKSLAINCTLSGVYSTFYIYYDWFDGSTLHNLLKMKEIACFFYIRKNIHVGLTATPRPPTEKLMHENFVHVYITIENSVL